MVCFKGFSIGHNLVRLLAFKSIFTPACWLPWLFKSLVYCLPWNSGISPSLSIGHCFSISLRVISIVSVHLHLDGSHQLLNPVSLKCFQVNNPSLPNHILWSPWLSTLRIQTRRFSSRICQYIITRSCSFFRTLGLMSNSICLAELHCDLS